MSKQLKVDDDIKNVELIDTRPIEEYLAELALDIITITREKEKFEKKVNTKEEEIKNAYSELLLNRKTIIKKKVAENRELNNLLSRAFPKDFKFKKAPIQKVKTTEELVCNRLIRRMDEKTKKIEKLTCVEEFTTERKLMLHVVEHKKNGELI